MMPPASATQLIDSASASEDAPARTTKSDRSRKMAFLAAFALTKSVNVIVALAPLTR
jgi:hypothetical protein